LLSLTTLIFLLISHFLWSEENKKKMHGSESVEGLVVTVLQGNKEAVLVNVVGDIRPEKLAMIGERFGIEPLKQVGKQLEDE